MEELLEQTLATLQETYRHLPAPDDNSAEIENLTSAIEQSEQSISDLQEKLSNPDNYKRIKSKFEVEDRPIIEDLLKESIDVQKTEIENNISEYTRLQNEQKERLEEYKEEIKKLTTEIENIQKILYKNSIAVSKNYKRLILTDDQVASLQAELQHKQELVELGNNTIQICSDEIKENERLIAECNVNKGIVEAKEKRLVNIQDYKINTPKSDIDTYLLRLDQDKLSSLEAGLSALKERKHFLEVDPRKKIADQINEIKKKLNEEKQKSIGNSVENVEEISYEPQKLDETLVEPVSNEERKEPDFIVVPPSEVGMLPPGKEKTNTTEGPRDLVSSITKQPTVVPPIHVELPIPEDEHKVVKVTSAKEFFKKHKKAILLAGGLTAIAVLAQPLIIPAIMHANSVLWLHSPAVIQGFLHSCNLALGNVIGASYASASGIWTTVAGATINATAAQSSLLSALAVHAVSLGTIGIAAKKMIEKIKNKAKKNKEEIDNDKHTVNEPIKQPSKLQQQLEKLRQVKNDLQNKDDEQILTSGGPSL